MRPIRTTFALVCAAGLAIACRDAQKPSAPAESAPAAETGAADAEADAKTDEFQIQADAVRALVRVFIAGLQRHSFDAAADNFHYDPDYDSEALAREKHRIVALLWAIDQNFGALKSANPANVTELDTVDLEISPNPASYWARLNSDSVAQTALSVAFERAPEASIVFQFLRYDGVWKIRSVHLGLPKTRADASAQIQTIEDLAKSQLGTS